MSKRSAATDSVSDSRKHVRFEDAEEVRATLREEKKGKRAGSAEDDSDAEEENDQQLAEEELQYEEEELEEMTERKIEPFNLQNERNLGQFDKSGSFTWKRRDLDDDEDEDKEWLDQVKGVVAVVKKKEEEEEEKFDARLALIQVANVLNSDEESVSEGLRRCANNAEMFNELSSNCSKLVHAGFPEIFSKSRGNLVQRLAGGIATRPLALWEYCTKSDLNTIQGPFSANDMQAWRNDGYFTAQSEDQCLIRRVGEQAWHEADTHVTFLL